jgi:hypothetical protein
MRNQSILHCIKWVFVYEMECSFILGTYYLLDYYL